MNILQSHRTASIIILFLTMLLAVIPSVGQSPTSLTNIDVVTMVKQKLSVAVIKAKIRSSTTNFDTSASGIQQLKSLGVPETLILFMIENSGERTSQPPAEPARTSNSSAPSVSPEASPAPQTAASLSAKRPGVPRIGIVTTTTSAPLEQDEAVRSQIYEVIYGNRPTSTSEAVLMREKLDKNIASEADYTKCDYLLFISLDSTIESAVKKRGNIFQKGIQAAAQGLGAATKLASPAAALSGITYRSYQMADSLQTSTTLLDTIADATEKNDRIGINFKLVKARTNEVVIPPTIKDIVAQKKREPILQNLLIQLGNQIINAIPSENIATRK